MKKRLVEAELIAFIYVITARIGQLLILPPGNSTPVVTLQNTRPFHIGTIEKSVPFTYRRGVPGLRSVPWLKYLFSVKGTKTENAQYIHYRNQMVYEARRLGEDKEILKQVDNQAPEYIKRSMLPLQEQKTPEHLQQHCTC